MKKFLSLFLFFIGVAAAAQSNLEMSHDPFEVRLSKVAPRQHNNQQALRNQESWKQFSAAHAGWSVVFNEQNQQVHKAWGKAIDLSDEQFQNEVLETFGWNEFQLVEKPVIRTDKKTIHRFVQEYNGLEVLFSQFKTERVAQGIVSFGADLFATKDVATIPAINAPAAMENALQGLPTILDTAWVAGPLKLLPVLTNQEQTLRLVYEVMIHAHNSIGIPQHYLTYVDAITGQVWMRQNQVAHSHTPGKPCTKACSELLAVDVNVGSTYYLTSPWDAPVQGVLPNLKIVANGSTYYTDANGNVNIPQVGPFNATFSLEGPWAKVFTGTATPSFSATLQEGSNVVSFDNDANIKERTAYRSVQDIHDHMKLWMPNFTGMDFQLPTNIDVTGGDCNAFYDGTSINFYDLANGCNASSNIPDVAYHEYGHGINDNYYQSIGAAFINGAMGEAYADFWAISLSNNPILGSGFYVDNQDPIRRYDIDPKVYPMDLVGEVHQDGEILMGAWWDTHLLMGADWNITIPLFVETYAGLQATAADGNEGQAYTDVLIDLLLADDNDGDITNGTPNGNAIVQGFYIHGISLISSAELVHLNEPFLTENTPIILESGLNLDFPYINYLSDVALHYQVNNNDWQEMPMTDQGGGQFTADIGAHPLATVVKYYMTVTDINNNIGVADPAGAHLSIYPNLPYVSLIGVSPVAVQDCDNNEPWGAWTTGVAGDNATTGIWELAQPISSITVDAAPGTIVQTGTQTTAGGEYCFVTGNALPNDGIGVNDVDGGHTTLQSPTMDFTAYVHPIIAYNRWYTNSPPGGANPGADWFQVQLSNDNGQTWTYLENTMTSDAQWRMAAYRVEDILTPTAQMKIRFIASDSLRPTVNLSGGSLVEAAMDDFIVYDEYQEVNGVDEWESNWTLYPNPVENGVLHLVMQKHNSDWNNLIIMDVCGRFLFKPLLDKGSNGVTIHCDALTPGYYFVKEGHLTIPFVVK
jgi:hypothetical protein